QGDSGDHGDLQGPGDRSHLGHAPGRQGLPGEAGVHGETDREGPGGAGGLTRMSATATLKSLRDKPFDLLRELERLARVALTGQGRDAAAEGGGVGVAFRLSSESFLAAREETREVLGYPSVVTRVPGAKPWIRGIANVRGQLLPVVD